MNHARTARPDRRRRYALAAAVSALTLGAGALALQGGPPSARDTGAARSGSTTAVLAGSAASQGVQKAANCQQKTIRVYPGDALPPYLRYGEVDFNVTVCPNQDASEWDTTASAATNGTGNTVGYYLESASLRTVATGENKKNHNASYQGSFTLKDCVPGVGWPCTRTYRVKVGFALLAYKKSGKVSTVYGGAIKSTMPRGLKLHRTP
ncbi:hypothetical protein P8605_02585 [Streptomyces sp. T-3]|nr:hypothetical protein [Streptomyces sp. T-3]